MQRFRIVIGFVLVFGVLCASSLASQQEVGGRNVTPRETVVLLHGLGRGKAAMWLLASRIEKAGFHVIRVGYDSLGETPQAILVDVARQIDLCCAALQSRVHFVGHSLGGLLIRAYLAEHKVTHLGRVVLIGTPNYGTPIVDRYRDSWWMNLAGPAVKALGTGSDSFPASLSDPHYPVGVIAGVKAGPLLDDVIAGDHDGLVPVESTKVPGMVDFIAVDSGHSSLRYSEEVTHQTVAFLQTGKFLHEP